jgi:hypothetical protein
MLPASNASRSAAQDTQASQPQTTAGQKEGEPRPPEQQPSAPVPPKEGAKPADQAPDQQQPPNSEGKPEVKPPEQVPSLPATSPAEESGSSQQPESKPAVPAADKPQTAESGKVAPKKKHKRNSRKRRTSKKVIVRDGGTSETTTQLAPDMSSAEASHAREATSRLISSAEANLRTASTRQLSQEQSVMVEQIKAFMSQSNAALKAGDLQRGHNLALKALLLSNDLVKQ